MILNSCKYSSYTYDRYIWIFISIPIKNFKFAHHNHKKRPFYLQYLNKTLPHHHFIWNSLDSQASGLHWNDWIIIVYTWCFAHLFLVVSTVNHYKPIEHIPTWLMEYGIRHLVTEFLLLIHTIKCDFLMCYLVPKEHWHRWKYQWLLEKLDTSFSDHSWCSNIDR